MGFELLLTDIQRAIKKRGFKTETKVQKQMISWMLEGRDIIVQSRTGSGKTMGYILTLPSFQRHGQTLVVLPTRELAI